MLFFTLAFPSGKQSTDGFKYKVCQSVKPPAKTTFAQHKRSSRKIACLACSLVIQDKCFSLVN